MKPDLCIPPNELDLSKSSENQKKPAFSTYEQNVVVYRKGSVNKIEKEFDEITRKIETINEIVKKKIEQKRLINEKIREDILGLNNKILEKEREKMENEQKRDELMKKFAFQMHETKATCAQIVEKNQGLMIELNELERKNKNLAGRAEEVQRQFDNYLAVLKTIDKENLELKQLVSEAYEKDASYNKIITNYEDTIRNYQLKRDIDYQELKNFSNKCKEAKGNIRIYCKIRPILPEEKADPARFDLTENSITVYKDENPCKFGFDRIFGPQSSIDEVFEEMSQIVHSALDGSNVCIFAYGQAGSGKTHTMEGSHKTKGILQKSIEFLLFTYKRLEEMGWAFSFYASAIEIYKNQIRDLLDGNKTLIGPSTSVLDPKSLEIHDFNELLPLLVKATKARTEAETEPSMSHFIFQLKIAGIKDSQICNGVLNLIDLAGSIRLKPSKSEGKPLEKAKTVNKSLKSLSRVIQALIKKDKHFPYTDSKLTDYLQNSLTLDSKISMFVNISPLAADFKETLNSLNFAQKLSACTL